MPSTKERKHMRNHTLIEKTVEITIARMSNTNMPVNSESGKLTAGFMQEIYNKLVELNISEENYSDCALADTNSARAFIISGKAELQYASPFFLEFILYALANGIYGFIHILYFQSLHLLLSCCRSRLFAFDSQLESFY